MKLLLVLGLALLCGGVYAVIDGWPYLLLERGFTEVIIGTIGASAGLLMLAQAYLLREIRRVGTGFADAVKMLSVTVMAGEVAAGPRASGAAGPVLAGAAAGAMVGAALKQDGDGLQELPPASDGDIAGLAERQPVLPFPDLRFSADSSPDDEAATTGAGDGQAANGPPANGRPGSEAAGADRSIAALDTLAAPGKDIVVDEAPLVEIGGAMSDDEYETLRAALVVAPSDRFAPASGAMKPPADEDEADEADLPAKEEEKAAAESDDGTVPAGAEEAAAEDDEDQPAPRAPASSDEGVIGAYQVGDAHFTMYADGSIKASTPEGDYTFGSMDELKAYLASEKSKLGA